MVQIPLGRVILKMTPNITAITTELITAIRILMSRDFGAVPAYNTLNRNTKMMLVIVKPITFRQAM